MAAPGGKYFIQDKLKQPAKHHESYEQLWATKWQKPVCFFSLFTSCRSFRFTRVFLEVCLGTREILGDLLVAALISTIAFSFSSDSDFGVAHLPWHQKFVL